MSDHEHNSIAPEIAISWQLGPNFGWGLFGLQIALQLKMSGRARPFLLSQMLPHKGDRVERSALEELWAANRKLIQGLHARRLHGTRVELKVPVLTALGNNAARQFVHPDFDYRGTETHGLVFLENPRITNVGLEAFNTFDTLTAGSSWARDILRDKGVPGTEVCIQGIDPALFHPAPRRGYLRDRFVIFSGGKLEFRKGQDIVIEAVKRFRERHPETQLICLWSNPLLGGYFVKLLSHSPYYPTLLDHVREDGFDWHGLARNTGLPVDAVMPLEMVDNWILPQVMREADVALFPNRCEGGTNMMAMQAMACGVPSILSANSGHLDIIEDGACIPLRHQGPVDIDEPTLSTEGWGESDVDEIVEALEGVYRDREKAREIGAAGADLMKRYTWEAQINKLASMIGL
jgi:glycosyltransferase involved in cell wall biosynthesis